MQTGYEKFVRDLQQMFQAEGGFGPDDIWFEERNEMIVPAGDRIFVRIAEHEDAWEVCAFYTEKLFERFRNGQSLTGIVSEMINSIEQIRESGVYEKTLLLSDYEKVKGNLFIRLLNVDIHASELKGMVYKTLGDIALVLYMKVAETKGCITSAKIHQEIVEQWDVDRDDVFKEALLNTYFISPPRIYRWEQMILNPEKYSGENFMDITGFHELKKDALGNCLSTVKKTNGAVAVFLPGVADRLAQLLDGDFYMVFTSIHEVMIHNVYNVYPEDLKKVLEETIEEATPKEDFLTSKIYRYSRKSGRFTCVTDIR